MQVQRPCRPYLNFGERDGLDRRRGGFLGRRIFRKRFGHGRLQLRALRLVEGSTWPARPARLQLGADGETLAAGCGAGAEPVVLPAQTFRAIGGKFDGIGRFGHRIDLGELLGHPEGGLGLDLLDELEVLPRLVGLGEFSVLLLGDALDASGGGWALALGFGLGAEGRAGPAEPGLAGPVPGGGGARWEAQEGDERDCEAHDLADVLDLYDMFRLRCVCYPL